MQMILIRAGCKRRHEEEGRSLGPGLACAVVLLFAMSGTDAGVWLGKSERIDAVRDGVSQALGRLADLPFVFGR